MASVPHPRGFKCQAWPTWRPGLSTQEASPSPPGRHACCRPLTGGASAGQRVGTYHVLVPQLTERLRDAENESMAKIAELEKQLSQARKELETLRVRLRVWAHRGWAGFPRTDQLGVLGLIPPFTLERGWGSMPGLLVGTDLSLGARRSASASRPPWASPGVPLSLRKCLRLPPPGPRP